MISALGFFAYTAIALLLLGTGGNYACKLLFRITGLHGSTGQGSIPKAGRIIGWLERTVIALGVVCGSWEVIAAVIALKTVARFKELDEQIPAEYFLVGSLFSLTWAVSVTGAWLAVDQKLGTNIGAEVRSLIKPPEEKEKADDVGRKSVMTGKVAILGRKIKAAPKAALPARAKS